MPRRRSGHRRRRMLGCAMSLSVLTVPAWAQSPAPAPADVDAARVQPLDLQHGCWEVRMTTHAYPPLAQLPGNDPATQRANAQARQLHEQGVSQTQTAMACTDAPFIQFGIEAYGSKTQACERSVSETGGVRHIRVQCPALAGQPAPLKAEYERISAGEFKGTRSEGDAGGLGVLDIAGKWISEAKPHLPASPPPTDLDGKTPRGATAVTYLDALRYVATIDGQQLTAAVAWQVLRAIPPADAARLYGPKLADQLQQIYMHYKVADQAIALGFALQPPWRGQLAAIGLADMTPATARANQAAFSSAYFPQVGLDDSVKRSYEEIREKVLWEAYFSQGKSEAEKQSMLHDVQQKYALSVLDPDFFAGP